MRKVLFLALAAGLMLFAHPMGNFSVNHYARLEFGAEGARLTYVLDLAEIPTFELMQQLGPEWKSKLRQEADQWLANVALTQNGRRAALRVISVVPNTTDGAAGMPVLRVVVTAAATLEKGDVAYEDRNFEGRAGWKEIVVTHDASARVLHSSQGAKDISKALTYYPTDPSITPPQDVTARVTWAPIAVSAPTITEAPAAPIAAPPFTAQQPQAPGTVVAGDYLSRLLGRKQLGWSLIFLGLAAAFGLGAMHAMSPGHGKTIVAAYLVGSRGTLKHAAFLGAMVTFTHTISVFVLGLVTLFLFQYVMPQKVTQVLGAVSGLSIVAIGGFMLFKRLRGHAHVHPHTHDHSHDHDHAHEHHHHHDHDHPHEHPHTHSHGPGGHTHSHVPDEVSWSGLAALGASGGLVPCESALVLLLTAIALRRVGLGLVLLVSFSVGLALVLMAIGVLVIYAKNLLPGGGRASGHPFYRWMPVASAAVVMVLGVVMTGVSLGWIQPHWIAG